MLQVQHLDVEVLFVNIAPTFALAASAVTLLEDSDECGGGGQECDEESEACGIHPKPFT